MQVPLRVTHTGHSGLIKVQVVRSDIHQSSEPQALEREQILAPGESTLFQVRSRSVLIIAQDVADADAIPAA